MTRGSIRFRMYRIYHLLKDTNKRAGASPPSQLAKVVIDPNEGLFRAPATIAGPEGGLVPALQGGAEHNRIDVVSHTD
jgi:hypothetical protein